MSIKDKEHQDLMEMFEKVFAHRRGPMSGEVTIIPPGGLSVGPVWQPIETAPMDGTEVILFYPHMADGLVTAGYFHIAEDDYESHWYADLVNGGASPPTHWMPLPLRPTHSE